MSVLIKDMEIPKNCEECIAGTYEYNDNDERCFVCGFIKSQHPWECEHVEIDGIDTTKTRADFCPLVEVPTLHGRLVDADVLMTEVMDSDLDHLQRDDWKEVIQIVQDAPTIIEAERSKA